MATKNEYQQLLLSIMSRASDAMQMLSEGDLSNFVTAVTDIEDDVNSLMTQVGKDEDILAVLEADAKAVLR